VQEGHIEVPRRARYFSLGPDGASELWIACHGYGQLAGRFLRRFAEIDDGSRLIVAPEALSRFYLDPPQKRLGNPEAPIGASWMTREDRESEIEDYVRYLDALHDATLERCSSGARVVVLGFSQGVATVCRWVERGRVRADDLVLWSGSLPPELFPLGARSRLREPRLTIVTGDADEYATEKVKRHQAATLRDSALEFRLVTHPGGHELYGDVLRSLSGR
jgi:predicted esterase